MPARAVGRPGRGRPFRVVERRGVGAVGCRGLAGQQRRLGGQRERAAEAEALLQLLLLLLLLLLRRLRRRGRRFFLAAAEVVRSQARPCAFGRLVADAAADAALLAPGVFGVGEDPRLFGGGVVSRLGGRGRSRRGGDEGCGGRGGWRSGGLWEEGAASGAEEAGGGAVF